MNYYNYVKGKDIPTIRRLDYIVKGTDNMESGYLYARFRKMSTLSLYNNPNLTNDRKSAQFEFSKKNIQERIIWVNDWMIANNREIIFTDINDWRAIGADYDYFWELRTKEQFVKEEAEARLGMSGRTPLKFYRESEFGKMIEEYIEGLKQKTPSGECGAGSSPEAENI